MLRRNCNPVETHLGGLYGYAFSLTKNVDDANDLVQETALKALGAKNVPGDSTAYRVWLFRILRNASIDRFRRNRLDLADVEELNLHLADTYWCREEEQINGLTVKMSFEKLPDGQREIIALIDIVGMTYVEVSTVLKIAPGTVKSRLSRARNALMTQVMEESSNRFTLKVGQAGK
ncbi:ECF RNA polymerase sigma factor SigR [bacterium BMS3Bbin10]|nr:ECF RNA polymerase sigma factor SigR [bacterium BMS3Bbin10]